MGLFGRLFKKDPMKWREWGTRDNLKCPYCKAAWDYLTASIFSAGNPMDAECSKCGKKLQYCLPQRHPSDPKAKDWAWRPGPYENKGD